MCMYPQRRFIVALILLAATCFVCQSRIASADDSLPAIRVQNVRRVFDNGEHNAFTDLIRWKGKYWLTFRSCPDGHMVFSTSSIIVLSSDDAKTWATVHQFSVPLRDTRDPHFLVFKDKLFIFTGTWYSGEGELPRADYDINKHLGFAVCTKDGETWSPPQQMEGTYGHYIWRAVTDGNTAWLCGRRKRGYSEAESGAGGAAILEGALLESTDGLNWKFRSLFQPQKGNETAFQILPDRTLIALSREQGSTAQLARARPPYLTWQRTELPHYIGGPLLAQWGEHWLVGGRRSTEAGPKTAIYWLVDDQLTAAAELPSGGDNSYPGFVALDSERGLLSWYSSHEKNDQGKTVTAVYLADLVKDRSR
ncbi:MAG: sialidase family protein [Fuerstiella sp.]